MGFAVFCFAPFLFFSFFFFGSFKGIQIPGGGSQSAFWKSGWRGREREDRWRSLLPHVMGRDLAHSRGLGVLSLFFFFFPAPVGRAFGPQNREMALERGWNETGPKSRLTNGWLASALGSLVFLLGRFWVLSRVDKARMVRASDFLCCIEMVFCDFSRFTWL